MQTRKTMTSAEKMQSRIKWTKRLFMLVVLMIDSIVALVLLLGIMTSWLPSLLSVSLGAIGISFASYVSGMMVLDFMLGTAVLLFETFLFLLVYVCLVRKIHRELVKLSHKVIVKLVAKKGAK